MKKTRTDYVLMGILEYCVPTAYMAADAQENLNAPRVQVNRVTWAMR
jgi:hypothetical protein